MKNITVSVPDDVYRAARIAAAERGSSVSALVGEYLRSLSEREARAERLVRLAAEITERNPGFRPGDRLSREELYDDALCRHERPAVRART